MNNPYGHYSYGYPYPHQGYPKYQGQGVPPNHNYGAGYTNYQHGHVHPYSCYDYSYLYQAYPYPPPSTTLIPPQYNYQQNYDTNIKGGILASMLSSVSGNGSIASFVSSLFFN
uniref:Uncharacterized protein n=1 Tax=Cucumis sativus TaxID=3659 RepID=A0A0A0KZN9_CUCSA